MTLKLTPYFDRRPAHCHIKAQSAPGTIHKSKIIISKNYITMKKLLVCFDYTFLGSIGMGREIEIYQDTTLEDVREEIAFGEEDMARDQRGEDEEGKTITAEDIELTQAYSNDIPGYYLSPEEVISFAKVYYKQQKP